jgi:hypothetical protein
MSRHHFGLHHALFKTWPPTHMSRRHFDLDHALLKIVASIEHCDDNYKKISQSLENIFQTKIPFHMTVKNVIAFKSESFSFLGH